MLTRRGWLVVFAAISLGSAGRLLGMVELFVLAAGAGVVAVLALVSVRLPRLRLVATRSLHPLHVHAGSPARIELRLAHTGRRTTPVLRVQEPVTAISGPDPGRSEAATFLVAPLRPGEAADAAHPLPSRNRGLFSVGPLEATVSDPFGLAAAPKTVLGAVELTVFPRVDPIAPLPHTRGHDPLAGVDHATAPSLSGDDLYGLRAYQVGDDLRRVHWPATAHRDELMVQQQEMRWQGRATVVLDVRRAVHRNETFESAISAAASIATACARRGSLVRLVCTDGTDTGSGAGGSHLRALLERLAVVEPSADDGLADLTRALRRAGNAGALAVVTTAVAPPSELAGWARLRRRFGMVTVVLFNRTGRAAMPGAPLPAGLVAVRVTGEDTFAAAWNRVMGGHREPAMARGAW